MTDLFVIDPGQQLFEDLEVPAYKCPFFSVLLIDARQILEITTCLIESDCAH
jgi:hypothetical protein